MAEWAPADQLQDDHQLQARRALPWVELPEKGRQRGALAQQRDAPVLSVEATEDNTKETSEKTE